MYGDLSIQREISPCKGIKNIINNGSIVFALSHRSIPQIGVTYSLTVCSGLFHCYFALLFFLGRVGQPYGYCQAGTSAEFSAGGEDLLMGTVGFSSGKGKNVDLVSKVKNG